MTIIYNIEKDKKDIQLFGSEFVSNNKNNCYLLIDGKKHELCFELELEENKKEKNELIVKLIESKSITNMSNMFYSQRVYSSLKSLPDISEWNTENINNIRGIFNGCSSLISLPDISKWDTENITDMKYIFCECSSLISLPDISKWDTKNVTDMHSMFKGCDNLLNIYKAFI